jgi:hypothetical protein
MVDFTNPGILGSPSDFRFVEGAPPSPLPLRPPRLPLLHLVLYHVRAFLPLLLLGARAARSLRAPFWRAGSRGPRSGRLPLPPQPPRSCLALCVVLLHVKALPHPRTATGPHPQLVAPRGTPLRPPVPPPPHVRALPHPRPHPYAAWQVNQFILRRTNTLLSKHLPPKLVQIVCVKLTPLQEQLYRHYMDSKAMLTLLCGGKQSVRASLPPPRALCVSEVPPTHTHTPKPNAPELIHTPALIPHLDPLPGRPCLHHRAEEAVQPPSACAGRRVSSGPLASRVVMLLVFVESSGIPSAWMP